MECGQKMNTEKGLKGKLEKFYFDKVLFGISFALNLGLSLYLIDLLQKLIDSATGMKKELFLHNVKLFFIALLLNIIVVVFDQFFFRKISNYGNIELRKFTFRSILQKKSFSNRSNQEGEVVSQMNNDVAIISNWFSMGIPTTIIQLTILVVCLVIMFWYSIEIAWFTIVVIAVTFTVTRRNSIKTAHTMELFQKILEEISGKTYESLNNIAMMKQLNKNAYFTNLLQQISEKNDKLVIEKLSHYKSIENSILNFLADILPICTFILGIILVSFHKLSMGSAFAIMLIAQKLNEPIIVLAELITEKKTTEQLFERMKEIYESPVAMEEEKIISVPAFEKLDITIQTYRFSNIEDAVLHDLALEIEQGDLITLKGESGRGKTTLINLISRFLPADCLEGTILYNGIDINMMPTIDYYKHVLQVEQNTVLFEGTLEENLCLGDHYTKEEIEEVIKVCNLEEFFSDRGFNYMISENGKNISGGEKQRIGLARILLRKPEVLILDEVTSALNEEIRETLVEKIVGYKKKYGMTMVVISHNDDFEPYRNKCYQI